MISRALHFRCHLDIPWQKQNPRLAMSSPGTATDSQTQKASLQSTTRKAFVSSRMVNLTFSPTIPNIPNLFHRVLSSLTQEPRNPALLDYGVLVVVKVAR